MTDICKYELRCVDRRVASNVPNLFFKVKRLQIKQVCDKVTLALRCFKTKGKKLKVKDILDDTERQKPINLDEDYYMSIRNSPAYLEKERCFCNFQTALDSYHYPSVSHVLKQNGQNY